MWGRWPLRAPRENIFWGLGMSHRVVYGHPPQPPMGLQASGQRVLHNVFYTTALQEQSGATELAGLTPLLVPQAGEKLCSRPLLGSCSRPLAFAHGGTCEYVTRATRERLIRFSYF